MHNLFSSSFWWFRKTLINATIHHSKQHIKLYIVYVILRAFLLETKMNSRYPQKSLFNIYNDFKFKAKHTKGSVELCLKLNYK